MGITPLLVNHRGELNGNFFVACSEVGDKVFVGVEYVVVLLYYYNISLKEPVGLMARQEHLKGIVRDVDGIAFGDFSGVTKIRVVWICHFSETEEGKEAC